MIINHKISDRIHKTKYYNNIPDRRFGFGQKSADHFGQVEILYYWIIVRHLAK